ncbi:hypothetical protein [Roseisolibacter sp. H3M3-2]|uniref:hypothetical protein n=1 Tax=Roseisolibacter sp. H3M3-2 TaxID=3031323 RepID=UPI0023DB7188|nr:hypothetical protein [Roseisolibacter sp. H3M3-2]MDF1506429.1 hypothetical protein [Roseisolibacter sp. H3M3-2]
MAINMAQLAKAAQGEPTARVTVNKAWLAEVHKLLLEGEEAKHDARGLRLQLRIRTSLDAAIEKLRRG